LLDDPFVPRDQVKEIIENKNESYENLTDFTNIETKIQPL